MKAQHARRVALAVAVALLAACEGSTAPLLVARVDVTAGYRHTCALTTDGSPYCWGNNGAGQLGIGSADTLPHATPRLVDGGHRFAAISAGDNATCALTAAGRAWCWGAGWSGVMGDGFQLTRTTPVAVAGALTFATISVGATHACALTSAGIAYCWGEGVHGQLGSGDNVAALSPRLVGGGHTFATLSAGETHTCGTLVGTGVAHCWGYNAHGALGTGTPTETQLLPTPVPGGQSFAAIQAGFRYTCGATTAGAAFCWGLNLWRELGAATPTSCLGFSDDFFPCSLTPMAVPVASATNISVGVSHTCAIAADAQAWCWGANWHGELGVGIAGDLLLPPGAVAGGLTFRELAVGGLHTCGVTKDQSLYCWGDNLLGQIGDGSITDRLAPVKITLPAP